MTEARPGARTGAVATVALTISMAIATPNVGYADEGGVSFWLPGLFGSMVAVPGVPGWSFATIYIRNSVAAGATAALPLGGKVVNGLTGIGNLAAFGPTYTFATPVLGGQASLSLFGVGGGLDASIAATLTGPAGKTISGTFSQATSGFGDVLPQGMLKWNFGVHNLMTYLTGDIPIGSYDATRIANLGIGHGAIDGGGGYTYFNPETGHELSAATGLTYNFANQALDYQNGVDFHLDWGASQFLTKRFFVGVVGYWFNQVSPDSGVGAHLGAFQSHVAAMGPQVGYVLPLGRAEAFVGLKGYDEFTASNRASGWNVWLTFSIAPAAPTAPASR